MCSMLSSRTGEINGVLKLRVCVSVCGCVFIIYSVNAAPHCSNRCKVSINQNNHTHTYGDSRCGEQIV